MKTINNFQIINQNVLLRVDLNVPVKDGIIIDKTRIYSIQSSVNQLRSNNNKIFLLSHFGRPNSKFNKKYSLKFLCEILANILQVKEVHFINSLDSTEIETKKSLMNSGDICLLENDEQVKCWKKTSHANLSYKAYVQVETVYSLINQQTGNTLAQTKVEIQSSHLKTQRRRLRSPWSFF